MKNNKYYQQNITVKKCYLIILVALFPFALLIAVSKPAYAVKELTYSPASEASPSLRIQLNSFLKENFNSDSSQFVLTRADLNGDNLLEYILKRNNCGQYTDVCTHLVIAEKQDELTLLSTITAHRLMVGDDQSYGIKNLLAFKNQTNAYIFDIYMWSPHEKMYILKADKKRD